jgi:hypothetical protein
MHSIKYLVAVHPTTGIIVWHSSPIPGSVHELTVARRQLMPLLRHGEKIFADKAYIGEECFIVPFRGPPDTLSPRQLAWNRFHTLCHFAHMERVNTRLKVWKVLDHRWRHSLDTHQKVFKAVVRLVNLDLLFRPLYGKEGDEEVRRGI